MREENNPEKVYSYIARENDKSTEVSAKPIPQARDLFRGNVLVLTNERSISAQEAFVSIFKNNERGLTIGQPTAGSYDGLCGGSKRKVVLPNSRFEIQIPLHSSRRTYVNGGNYNIGEGFPPDIKITESIDSFLSGKDLALEMALDQISKGQPELK
jgi:C-terminal processing protease CtpA/Prc